MLTAVAALGLLASMLGFAGTKLTLDTLFPKLLLPLFRVLCFLAVGLLAGQILELTGWSARLSRAGAPLTRWAGLKEESGAAFIASFVSGVLANTLLMNYFTEKKLNRRELTLTYLLNAGLPLYLVHLPTTFFVVCSLAGQAGLVYTALNFAAACMRSGVVLVFSRFTRAPWSSNEAKTEAMPTPGSGSEKARLFDEIRGKFQPRFLRLVLYTVPIYAIMFLLNEWGMFVWMREGAAAHVGSTVFPVESAGVVIFALAAEFSSGMAAAGALMDAGALTVKQTVTALMLGTIIATPIRAIRHQLPTHAGLFTLALGARLLLLSQVFRIAGLILVMIPYLLWE